MFFRMPALKGSKAQRQTLTVPMQADLLADTIAIMAEGRLLSAGSSFALKRHWSNGCACACRCKPLLTCHRIHLSFLPWQSQQAAEMRARAGTRWC